MLVAIGESFIQFDDEIQNDNIAYWELDDIEDYVLNVDEEFKDYDNILWVGFGNNWRDALGYRILRGSAGVAPFYFRDYDYSLYEIANKEGAIIYRTAAHDWPCGKYEALIGVTEEEADLIEEGWDNLKKILKAKDIMVGGNVSGL